jgi:hypothetical protein
MISSISGGMPSMQSFQAMKQQVFSKADTSGNGTLDIAEFKSLATQAPAGKAPPGVQDPENFFKTADADGNGQLTDTELQGGMERAMQAFRSTMSMAGGAGATSMPNTPKSEQDAWKTLLDSLQQNGRSHQAAQRAYAGTVSAGLSVSA